MGSIFTQIYHAEVISVFISFLSAEAARRSAGARNIQDTTMGMAYDDTDDRLRGGRGASALAQVAAVYPPQLNI